MIRHMIRHTIRHMMSPLLRRTMLLLPLAALLALTLGACDPTDPLSPIVDDGEAWSIPCGTIATEAELDYFGRRTNLVIRFFIGADDSMTVDWSEVQLLYNGAELDYVVSEGLDGATTIPAAGDSSIVVTDTTVVRFHVVFEGVNTRGIVEGEESVRFEPEGFIRCDGDVIPLTAIAYAGEQ